MVEILILFLIGNHTFKDLQHNYLSSKKKSYLKSFTYFPVYSSPAI
jgi:hypothetical protein